MAAITANNLFAAVYVRWQEVPALAVAFPGSITRGRQKEVPAFAYCVFTSISNVRVFSTSDSETWESVFKFSVFTPDSPEAAGEKAKIVATAFDPAVLVISGAKMERIRRINDKDADSQDWNVDQMDLMYECQWTKPRSDRIS